MEIARGGGKGESTVGMGSISFEEFLTTQRGRVKRTLASAEGRINRRRRERNRPVLQDMDVERKIGSLFGGHSGKRCPDMDGRTS